MITLAENNITNRNLNNNYNKKQQTFKGGNGLNGVAKAADLFIKSQENLSSTRFIQDTITNWAPKAVFSRSTADFAEMSFLEFLESGIFYFASPFLGEKLFRNNFKSFAPKNIREKVNEQLPKTVTEITKNTGLTDEVKKRAVSTKAGIVLACAAIPVAEYTLSFAKNLFTLKTFKKSNFDNIANLDEKENTAEDKKQQELVEKHSKYQLKKAAVISAAGIAAGAVLAANGHKSDKLQTLSKTILEPGKAAAKALTKAGVKSDKVKDTISKFSLDFANENGKLALSKGQLALTAILGLFGYSKAAEDRGKRDVAEVWTRVPLVVFYTIFGSELFEKGFGKILEKKNKFPDLLQKNAEGKLVTPARKELPELAKKIAATKKTDPTKELARLTKEKAFISAVPYAFSIVFMGLTLSAITRLTTQIRYNHQAKENNKEDKTAVDTFNNFIKSTTPEIYKEFNA